MYKLAQNSIIRLSDNACIPLADGNMDYETYKAWIAEGNTPEPEDIYVAPITTEISALQARLALNEIMLRQTVENAVLVASQDIKDFYEFATIWKRDNQQLINMATSLGMTATDIDNFFVLASMK